MPYKDPAKRRACNKRYECRRDKKKRRKYERAYRRTNANHINSMQKHYYYKHHKSRLKYKRAYRMTHRKAVNESRRNYYQRNKELCWARTIERLYGINSDDYYAKLKAQRGQCKICGTTKFGLRNTHLHIDHDHKTKRIRGLLCGRCNKMLGLARDNWRILQRAIYYLRNS